MKFPVMTNHDIPLVKKVEEGIGFYQEVDGVVDAVIWRLRTSPTFGDEYWIARSNYSNELLAVEVVKKLDPKIPVENGNYITLSDQVLAEVDVKWKKLATDLEAELEQNLEVENNYPGEKNEPKLYSEAQGSEGGTT